MTSRTTPRCTRGVLSIDTPDDAHVGICAAAGPRPELLDRAHAGPERFPGTEGPSDG